MNIDDRIQINGKPKNFMRSTSNANMVMKKDKT